MNIGIDTTSLIYQRGVSRYTRNLIIALALEGKTDLSLFGYSLRQHDWLEQQLAHLAAYNPERTRYTLSRMPQTAIDYAWRFGLQPVRKYLPAIDVFHSWDWMQPPDQNIPLVSTIHDLAILKFPETAHPKILAGHQRSWKRLKQAQARIIAPSRATKNDIVELLGYPNYLIDVVHEALPREIVEVGEALTQEEAEGIEHALKLDRPFVFFVGTREPRKNLERLIAAWEPLAAEVSLLIAGESGWDATSGSSQQQAYQKYQDKGLRFLGRVTDKELSVLYAQAAVFAFPSLYEGFGLPILEAFHHGTPVVTSDNSALIEVAGNAAELVDPLSVESIREGIRTILSEDLAAQQKRLQRMIIRQHMFSWQQVAQQTRAVYTKAYDEFHN